MTHHILIPMGGDGGVAEGGLNRYGQAIHRDGFGAVRQWIPEHMLDWPMMFRWPDPPYGEDLHPQGITPMGAATFSGWTHAMRDSVEWVWGVHHGLATAIDTGDKRRWMRRADLPGWEARMWMWAKLGVLHHLLDAPAWRRRGFVNPDGGAARRFMADFYTACRPHSQLRVWAENPRAEMGGLVGDATTLKSGDWSDEGWVRGLDFTTWADSADMLFQIHDPELVAQLFVEGWEGGPQRTLTALPKLLEALG